MSAMSTNPFFLEKFSKNLEESYNDVRYNMKKLGKKRKIRIVDAF